MFLAMNRFKITPGFEAGFEKIWRERDSHLSSVPGFKKFSLPRTKQKLGLKQRRNKHNNFY